MSLESRSMIGAINFFLKKKCCLSAECVCVCVRACLSRYLSIYIYIYTNIHTHTHIYICILRRFSRVQLFVTA